jgi:hydroxyacylglutathione hydrolase
MDIFKGDDDHAHVYLICRFDKCYLIDPSHSKDEIENALSGRTLSGILLTHAHSDHTSLIGMFPVPVHIHKEDAHLLFDDRHNGYQGSHRPYARKDLDLVLIDDGDTLPLADQSVSVLWTPGHTRGSVTYLYQNRLFTGDTLFRESVGRHDLYSGSLPDLKKSVLKLLGLPSSMTIHPGHDDKSDVRHERVANPFFQKWDKQLNRKQTR